MILKIQKKVIESLDIIYGDSDHTVYDINSCNLKLFSLINKEEFINYKLIKYHYFDNDRKFIYCLIYKGFEVYRWIDIYISKDPNYKQDVIKRFTINSLFKIIFCNKLQNLIIIRWNLNRIYL